MYTLKALAIRKRCTATRKDGRPCRAWSMWDHSVCVAHSHRKKSGPHSWPPAWYYRGYGGTNRNCNCNAYKFPHRPGGGLCRWPDSSTHTHVPTPDNQLYVGVWPGRRKRGRHK